MDFVESRKIQITPVEKINGARFEEEFVEQIDLVNLALNNENEGVGMLPRKLEAYESRAFALTNWAQGKTDGQRSMVLASKAYTAS